SHRCRRSYPDRTPPRRGAGIPVPLSTTYLYPMANALRTLAVAALVVGLTPLAFAQSAKTTASQDRPDVAASDDVVNYARGGVTVYTSRATFEGDNPGLPTEDFEEAAGTLACTAFDGPVNSATNNQFFSPG